MTWAIIVYDNLTGKTLIAGDDGIFYWCGENKKTSVTRPRFIGIDSQGIPRYDLSIQIAGDGNKSSNESEMIQTYDKGFVMAGSVGDLNGTTQNIRIIKLSQTGGYQWHADLPKNITDYSLGIIREYPFANRIQGGFVVAGMVSTGKNQPENIYMARCFSADSVIWEKSFESLNDDKVSKIIRVDGGYALIGTAVRINTKLITIMRTDLEGNIISGD